MKKVESYYGKLPPESLKELDSLLLELKEANSANKGKRVISRSEIVSLPEDKYLKLWGYLNHCCKLVSNWDNVNKAIRVIASKTMRPFSEVQEECIMSMTIHVYTYAWRHYEHSEDSSAYVLSTAKFGFCSWIKEQNSYFNGIAIARSEAEDMRLDRGRKVCTLNIS